MSFKEIIKLKFDHRKTTNNIDELAQHYLNMKSEKISSETIIIGKIPFFSFQSTEEEIFAQDRDLDQFDEIIGCIEDIVIEKNFEDLQESFLERNYHHFEVGTEENKLIYTDIFHVSQ